MASYYLTGYTTPTGVDSREKVKDYQRLLGVSADGIWGPVTQAAYEKYGAAASSPYSASTDAFTGYYQTILGAISTPGISVSVPSRDQIAKDYETMLRPSVDLAIDRRRTRGEEALAEIDADAASRGMLGSTYVTSVKEREDDDVEDDISMMEAQYAGTLAERIAAALEYYTSLELQASSANAQMAAAQSSTAASIAAQWYQSYLSGLAPATAAKSGGGSSTRVTQAASPRLTTQDYLEYVAALSGANRVALFSSADPYWQVRREELNSALGARAFNALQSAYAPMLSTTAGGGSQWLTRTK